MATPGKFILGLGKLRRRKILAVKELRSGVPFRVDPKNPRRGWATCPMGGPSCEGERYLQFSVGATGICKPCSSIAQRTLTGKVNHPTGALILYDKRDPTEPKNHQRRMFLCANRSHNSDCLRKSAAWLVTMHGREWRGLCPACLRFEGSLRRIREDRTLPNGTRILYSEEDERGMVPIEFSLCKHQRKELRRSVTGHARRLGVACRACFESPATLAKRLVELQKDVPQESKKKTGRPAKITEATVKTAFNALGAAARQEEVAEHIGVTDRAFRDWLRAQDMSYRQCQQIFVETGRK